MQDWNSIRAFLQVAETGSLSKASEDLKLSQPTLGRYITRLEHQVGEALFVRSRNGMELTKVGLQLVGDAREMQTQANQFSLKAAGHETAIKGTVRITASDVMSTYILPEILVDFRTQHPEIDIELVPSNVQENLLARDADIAVRMLRPVQSDLIALKVNDLAVGAWATQTYLEKFGTPETKEQIFDHQLIGYDRNDMMIKVMSGLGVKVDRSFFGFRTDDQVAYWELVKAGAGLGFGANYVARKSSHLVHVLPQMELVSLPMWLTSHAELKTNARIRLAMDFLRDRLKVMDLT